MVAEPSQKALARTAYRARSRRRSFLVALASTVVVAGLAWWVLVSSPGWERTREAFFDPARFVEMLPALTGGLWLDLRVWVIAGAISLALGLLPAVARRSEEH